MLVAAQRKEDEELAEENMSSIKYTKFEYYFQNGYTSLKKNSRKTCQRMNEEN